MTVVWFIVAYLVVAYYVHTMEWPIEGRLWRGFRRAFLALFLVAFAIAGFILLWLAFAYEDLMDWHNGRRKATLKP